ncbi:cupredoxin domain-containing protein [Marinobacteraceae bacterium S3BR75-40.1]
MTAPLRRALGALFILALALPAWAGLPNYDLQLKDGELSPQPLHVKAGERFKISLHNAGSGPAEFESDDLRLEKVLSPGARSFVVVYPLKPGEYDIFDEFHLPESKGRIIAE